GDAAGRPTGRRREQGVGYVRRTFGNRLCLQQVEPERQMVAVRLDRPEGEDDRGLLVEPLLKGGRVELLQAVDHPNSSTVRTPPFAGSAKASSSSSRETRRPTRSATGIAPSAHQARSCGRCFRGCTDP